MKKVILHIDRLVLNGFDRLDRDAIAEGLRQELVERFGESAAAQVLMRTGNQARIRVGNVSIRSTAIPESVGAEAAKGIARRLGS